MKADKRAEKRKRQRENKKKKLAEKKVDGMRLDYIWCNKKKEILSSRVVFNGLKEPVVSDHYGVLIEIKE